MVVGSPAALITLRDILEAVNSLLIVALLLDMGTIQIRVVRFQEI